MTIVWIIASACWLFLSRWLIRRTCSQRLVTALIVVAALCHLAAFFVPPYYSDDISRYQWDGIVASHGISPYRYAPNDHALDGLHVADLPARVTFPHMHTIYPPVAEWWFAGSTWLFGESALWKLPTALAVVISLLLVWRILRERHLPQRYVLIAALSPVVILHGTMDAHIDVVMVMFLLMAVWVYKRRPVVAGIMLALGIGVKFLPFLFVPWMLRSLSRRHAVYLTVSMTVTCALILAVSYDPWMFTALKTYTSVWSANSIWPMLLHQLFVEPRTVRYVLFIAVAIMLAVVWFRRRENDIIGMQLFMMSVIVFSPVLHPWYVIPAIMFASIRPMRSTIVMAATLCVYGVIVEGQKESGVWLEHPALIICEIVPVIIALALDIVRPPLLLDEGAVQHRAST